MKITRKELREMINESVSKALKNHNFRKVNESLDDPYDENVAKEVEEVLSQIDPKTFMMQCKGKTNEETAEYLYKMYLDKFDCKVLSKLLNRGGKVPGIIRNLGGFPLMFCLSMYCTNNSK